MSGEIVVKDFEDNKKAEVIRKTSNITSIDVGGEQVLIEDNFLPEDDFKEIQEYYLGSSSPWYWANHKVKESYDDESSEFYSLNDYQLVHVFFNGQVSQKSGLPATQSSQIESMSCILKRLPMYALLRLKLNLNPRTDTHWISGFHTDSRLDNLTSIFYFNTFNGSTVFEKCGEVDSVENRLITFPANLRHASKTTTNVKARYVLNINYFPLTKKNFINESSSNEERFVHADPKFLE